MIAPELALSSCLRPRTPKRHPEGLPHTSTATWGWVGAPRWLRTHLPRVSPQAVIQNPFSNGGSPAAEAVSGEARFAYFPASSVGDTTAVSVQTTDQSLQAGGKRERSQGMAATLHLSPVLIASFWALTLALSAGQFYVMMTPQDVLQTGTQRTIAPRTHPYSP